MDGHKHIPFPMDMQIVMMLELYGYEILMMYAMIGTIFHISDNTKFHFRKTCTRSTNHNTTQKWPRIVQVNYGKVHEFCPIR